MSEWKEYRFSDFVGINPQVSLKRGAKYSFVEMANLQDGNKFCEASAIRQFAGSGMRFRDKDTLFARITPCLENGKICQVRNLTDNTGFGSTEFYVFRGKDNLSDTDFIYYLTRWSEVRDYAEANFHGTSGRQRVPRESFDNFFLRIPPLPEQRAIADVLASLDDKIDLLHRQNKTLEGMAEALWRKMLAEDGTNSKIVNLGDLIDIHDSKRIPLSSMQREKMKDGVLYPYYGAATIMDYINQYIFDGEFLLLGEDGTVETDDGYPVLQLATGKFWVNNHTHVLQAKKPFSNFLLYIVLRNTPISHIVTGAVQPKINQENLKSLGISSPNDIIVEKLSTVVDNFWLKIQANNLQLLTLSRLRDTLLPRLMSGELRVKI